jgi:hypothetical protein
MSDYDNELRGVLFKNDRKEQDRHPDYKGSCEIGGVEYWISSWLKDGRNGKFLSLAFTEKDQQGQTQQRRDPPPRETRRDDRDDLGGRYSDRRPQAPAPAPAQRTQQRQAPPPQDFQDDDIPF